MSQSELERGLTKAMQPTVGRSHDAVIRVYDEAGNVIQTHEQASEFKEPCRSWFALLGRARLGDC